MERKMARLVKKKDSDFFTSSVQREKKRKMMTME
jgi:hypothetical protein